MVLPAAVVEAVVQAAIGPAAMVAAGVTSDSPMPFTPYK
jgi:hypothetical protein